MTSRIFRLVRTALAVSVLAFAVGGLGLACLDHYGETDCQASGKTTTPGVDETTGDGNANAPDCGLPDAATGSGSGSAAAAFGK